MGLAILIFEDVAGEPQAKIDLPFLRLGDRLRLKLQIARKNGGRSEVLDVAGEYRVASCYYDAARPAPCQILHVSATGVSPAWRAVKNPKPVRFTR